jgi:16S rRNA (adenine1518-N6/adenine1519-N6)-dimethyltransferase
MNLTSPSQVKAWCIENGFHPNRTMGQNFLIDRNALVSIVDAGLAPVAASDAPRILEIGPGLGVLTEEMLARGCTVAAVEKDPVLAARLADALGRPAGLGVTSADALDWIACEPAEVLASFDGMISNLPYQVGTRILSELVTRRAVPAMTVLVQTDERRIAHAVLPVADVARILQDILHRQALHVIVVSEVSHNQLSS